MFKREKPTYLLLKKSPKKGLEKMYRLYGTKLCAYALKNWSINEDEAWDLIYKTMYKIAQNITSYEFESEAKFGAFIYKVFINYLRNYFRDQKNKNINTTELNHETDIEEKTAEIRESENLKQLNLALEQLEDWQRMLLLLRAQDMPYSEIAKYVDKPEQQLKVYYGRLKSKIENQLKAKQQISVKPESKKEVEHEA